MDHPLNIQPLQVSLDVSKFDELRSMTGPLQSSFEYLLPLQFKEPAIPATLHSSRMISEINTPISQIELSFPKPLFMETSHANRNLGIDLHLVDPVYNPGPAMRHQKAPGMTACCCVSSLTACCCVSSLTACCCVSSLTACCSISSLLFFYLAFIFRFANWFVDTFGYLHLTHHPPPRTVYSLSHFNRTNRRTT